MKSETVEFLSVELLPIGESSLSNMQKKDSSSDKVWVVKYECEARTSGLPGMTPPPFTRHFIQTVIDVHTGE